ncbi:MAG: peptidoglycan binding protein CsiV [Gammaproteobacteria bacterium]|nr:peptidoglycan binding protein CsiV [Gammaproteobacteria bacterium]
MNKHLSFIIVSLLSLVAHNAHAAINQYNVEIVIFEDLSSRYINSEQWPIIIPPSDNAMPDNESSNNTVNSLSNTFTTPESIQENKLDTTTGNAVNNNVKHQDNNSIIQVTHETTNELVAYVDKLSRSSRYNVLIHQSWQQTGLDSDAAISIQIGSIKGQKEEITILGAENNLTVDKEAEMKSSVTGSIKLILGRYLHIHTDLLYKRPRKNDASNIPTSASRMFDEFEIKSQRRMRSKELHYLDHPLLGVLVLVTPIETPEQTGNNIR